MTRLSSYLLPTLKEAPADAEATSHKLMVRAGLIRQLGAGMWTYLPAGWRVQRRIEQIVRAEMDAIGAQEMLMPILQPAELWQKTGRDEIPEIFKLSDRNERRLLLAMTHEENVTYHVAREVGSYRELPLILYHIQTKERDEPRPRAGILRTREFIMKDSYSFDRDEEALEHSYQLHIQAYDRIFTRCGLEWYRVESDVGMMGGLGAHEYMAPCVAGENEIALCTCGYAANVEVAMGVPEKAQGTEERDRPEWVSTGDRCPKCGKALRIQAAIEVGNIFKLGTRYSEPLGATYLDEKGRELPIVMGSYGIGPARIAAAVVEQRADDRGIAWPRAIAPFEVELVAIGKEGAEARRVADGVYEGALEAGIDVLYDDRNISPGQKFADAELVGCPLRLTVGKRTIESNKVEVQIRKGRTEREFPTESAVAAVASLLAEIE